MTDPQQDKPKPYNYAQAVGPDPTIPDLQLGELFDGQEPDGDPDSTDPQYPQQKIPIPFALPDATDDIPEWVKLPPGLRLPRNKQVIFVRFRASLTDTPSKGERQAIVWSNNLGDQRLALGRADRDPNAMSEQLTKQMIRVVDGVVTDWTGEVGVGNIDSWWDAIGPKCRQILDRIFIQLHVASPDESRDFLENCVAVRVVGG